VPDVALIHDYFVQDGGGERVAIELARLLPAAPIYTSFFEERVFGDRIDPRRVQPWPLQGRIDSRSFRRLAYLYPIYFSALDLRAARLVVSSSSAFAKAVRTSRRALHVSYVHTPLRLAYNPDAYFGHSRLGALARSAGRVVRAPFAIWDRRTARQPDVLVANSHTVRERIRQFWDRDAEIIHPPVSVAEFAVSDRDDGFLLICARLLAYRRIEVAVRAANAARRELVVIGDGPERDRLAALAGPTVKMVGWLPRARLIDYFERCHAYVVPGEEDFGIAPVEAMAAGKPVVALARGGATESVVDGVTGVLFSEPSPAALGAALDRLDHLTLEPSAARAQAELFDTHHFLAAWRALLARLGVDQSLYQSAA
jgi:glycosyltransferase involved in cell wall biosynthesis